MTKSVRHNAIIDIVDHRDIRTQLELTEALAERGIDVTQATISRDIRELNLVKVQTKNGEYKYATVNTAEKSLTERFIRIFSETVVSVVPSENMVVIKTVQASANAAGEAVDALDWPEVLGCIAGDNTLLVVLTSKDVSGAVAERFRAMLR